jgi:threonine/homoserine/homoserine lactone efflux protein
LTAALGIHVGGYAHVVAAALGLTVLLSSVPGVYGVLKLVGSLYLIWLGLKLVASSVSPPNRVAVGNFKSSRDAFRESIVVELLNPKTAVFYLAFLPQFTDLNSTLPFEARVIFLGVVVTTSCFRAQT